MALSVDIEKRLGTFTAFAVFFLLLGRSTINPIVRRSAATITTQLEIILSCSIPMRPDKGFLKVMNRNASGKKIPGM